MFGTSLLTDAQLRAAMGQSVAAQLTEIASKTNASRAQWIMGVAALHLNGATLAQVAETTLQAPP
jgi:hypothetical protein